MTISSLHEEVKKIAGARPAFVVSRDMLRALALSSIEKSMKFFDSVPPGEQQTFLKTANPHVAGRYQALLSSGGTAVELRDFQVQLQPGEENPVDLYVTPSFLLIVELFDPVSDLAFSTVHFECPPSRYPIDAAKNRLTFLPPLVNPLVNVFNSSDRAAAIAATGISNDDLLRVEGSMAYGTGARMLQTVMGEIAPIDLDAVFPAFRFGGKIDASQIGENLVLIPETFTFIGNTGCPQGDALDGVTVLLPEQLGGRSGASGEINVPPPKSHQKPYEQYDGLLMAYLPKPVLQVQFEKISPAAAYRDHDHGFIGYDLSVNVLLKSAQLAIDVIERALTLQLGLSVDGAAKITVDVPCIGRVTAARVDFNVPGRDRTALVDTWVRFAVDARGRLCVLTELKPLSLGGAEVEVEIFSRYASYLGGEAKLLAYIADYLIQRVLVEIIPRMLEDELRKTLNQHFFVFLDMERQLKYFFRKPNAGTWSGEDSSVLIGLNYLG